MNSGETTEISVHDEVQLLLPWYVNGTLRGNQRARVDEHVRDCITCRKELVIENRTLEIFLSGNALDHSAQAGFERLSTRLRGKASHPWQTSIKSSNFLGTWFEYVKRYFVGVSWGPAWNALPVAVVILSVGFFAFRPEPQNGIGGSGLDIPVQATVGYQTLSNAQSGVSDADDIHVIFASGTASGTMEQILEALPARIIDGPNAAGAYVIRLLEVGSSDDRQAAILKLRGQREVLFVEAAQPLAVAQPDEKKAL